MKKNKIIRKRINNESNYSPMRIAPRCLHRYSVLRKIAQYCTVEVTALFCADCGKQLTEEEWEA